MTHAADRSFLHLGTERPSSPCGPWITGDRSPRSLRPSLRTRLTRGLVLATLTSLGVLSGISADLSSRTPRLLFQAPAQAQSYSDTDIVNYARAFLAIEPVRQQAIREIGSSATGIVCSESDSFDSLPREHRSVAINYCNRSREIVATFFGSDPSGRQRFNDIYRRIRGNPPADPALYQRVLGKICELAPDKCNR